MLARIRLSIIVMSIALMFGHEVTISSAKAGEWSAEYRAGIQRIVEHRKQKHIARFERRRAEFEYWKEQQYRYLQALAQQDAARRKENREERDR